MDLTVRTVHTFAVGDGAFVVHNCGRNGRPDATNLGDDTEYYYKGQRREGLKQERWTKTRDVTKDNDSSPSETTSRYIGTDYVFDDTKWRYHIETWQRGGTEFENHYWENAARMRFGTATILGKSRGLTCAD